MPDGTLLTGKTVGSFGLYSYLTYKFHRQWSAGFLYDFVESAQNKGARTSAYSPYVTCFSSYLTDQLRLQYTYTDPNTATGLESDSAFYFLARAPDLSTASYSPGGRSNLWLKVPALYHKETRMRCVFISNHVYVSN